MSDGYDHEQLLSLAQIHALHAFLSEDCASEWGLFDALWASDLAVREAFQKWRAGRSSPDEIACDAQDVTYGLDPEVAHLVDVVYKAAVDYFIAERGEHAVDGLQSRGDVVWDDFL